MVTRCIHSFHATSETGRDLGWLCAFCKRKNRMDKGIIVTTDPEKCATLCAHYEPYKGPRKINVGRRKLSQRDIASGLYELYGADDAPTGPRLDIADHPCAVRWLPPHTTREQPRLSDIIRKARNE